MMGGNVRMAPEETFIPGVMKRRYASTLFVLIMLLVGSTTVRAQKVGTTAFQFLKVSPDARSAAIGNIALPGGGMNVAGAFLNPAFYTLLDGWGAASSYTRWIMDVPVLSIAGGRTFHSFGSVGFHARYVSYGEMEETNVENIVYSPDGANPGLTGATFSPYALQAGLAYGRRLTDRFSFGLSASFMREDLYAAAANGVSFDGGLIFRTGFRSLTLSTAVRNFGPEVTFVEKGFPLPQTFDIGLSAHVFSPESSLLGPMSSSSLLVAVNLVDPRDYGQQYNVGFEYGFSDRLFLRSGYRFNHDVASLGVGFGLNFGGIQFDYAYNSMDGVLNSIHRFSIGFTSR